MGSSPISLIVFWIGRKFPPKTAWVDGPSSFFGAERKLRGSTIGFAFGLHGVPNLPDAFSKPSLPVLPVRGFVSGLCGGGRVQFGGGILRREEIANRVVAPRNSIAQQLNVIGAQNFRGQFNSEVDAGIVAV